MKGYIKNNTPKQINFIGCVVEIYKNSKNITGRETSKIFTAYHIYEFLYDYYEAMHIMSPNWIVEEIDEIIKNYKLKNTPI
jgi:translation initiation factor IF-2